MAIPVNSVPQFKSVWVLSCHLLQLLPEVKLLGALPSTLEPFCALPASNVQLPEQYVILCLVCKQKRKASCVFWVPENCSHLLRSLLFLKVVFYIKANIGGSFFF